jgi:dTDP-4-dehydrorhamnose reductase
VRILVTGISGQVGSELTRVLAPFGILVPADRATLNLGQPDTLSRRLEELAPDLIVNAAAYTAVDRAEDEPGIAFAVNAESPGVMARFAAERGIPLIHFSTDYVFDGSGSNAWRETDPTEPISIYGASKLAGDQAVRQAGGRHLIARTSWVYAARGTNFMRTIARLAAEREQLTIVADQTGAPTSAAFIAETIADILKQSRDRGPQLADAQFVINVAAAGETTWHGFAQAIVEGLRLRGVALKVRSVEPIRTEDYAAKAKRPGNSRLDLTMLKARYGISPPNWATLLERELDKLAPLLLSRS